VREKVERVALTWPRTQLVVTAHASPRSLGPGAARNRGLTALARTAGHEGVIFFDDDISFADCDFQGRAFCSDGAQLLGQVAGLPVHSRSVLGCGYRGRQDLALLDHINLSSGRAGGYDGNASCERQDIENEAPGGLTGAFLFVPERSDRLPKFLPGYNEDYFWLRRMQRDGFELTRSTHRLVHAPREGLEISSARLWFEQRGETVWCASQGIERGAAAKDLRQRLLHSLAARISELEAAGDLLRQGGPQPGAERAASALRRTTERLRRLKVAAEQYAAGNVLAPQLLTDLQRIARYCGR